MNIVMIAHLLTAALVFAKMVGLTNLSWWLVLSPSIAGLILAIMLGIGVAIADVMKQTKGRR